MAMGWVVHDPLYYDRAYINSDSGEVIQIYRGSLQSLVKKGLIEVKLLNKYSLTEKGKTIEL